MKYKTFVKGHGINEEDFMWMWSHYQNRSYANFVNSTSLANLSQTPNVILWNSHLTDKHFLHYLVSWGILHISKIQVDNFSRIQRYTPFNYGQTAKTAMTKPSREWLRLVSRWSSATLMDAILTVAMQVGWWMVTTGVLHIEDGRSSSNFMRSPNSL